MLADLLHQRRSVRKYQPQAPPLNWLEDIVACGRSAPSPSNSQPVRVRRIASDQARGELQHAMARQRDLLLESLAVENSPKRLRNYIRVYYRYSEFMFAAPWLLLVGTVPVAPGFGDHMALAGLRALEGKKHTDRDITVGLFVSAMLLRATELGLGSCILTAPLVFLEPEKHLTAFEGLTPKCFVALGFRAEDPPMPARLDLSAILESC